MGVITLALIANGTLAADADPPFWVIVSAATAIALGTYSGGWRIIEPPGRGSSRWTRRRASRRRAPARR